MHIVMRSHAYTHSQLAPPHNTHRRKHTLIFCPTHAAASCLSVQKAPAVIFFDELDGLAPVRSARQNQVRVHLHVRVGHAHASAAR